jgi:hypothetical protein
MAIIPDGFRALDVGSGGLIVVPCVADVLLLNDFLVREVGFVDHEFASGFFDLNEGSAVGAAVFLAGLVDDSGEVAGASGAILHGRILAYLVGRAVLFLGSVDPAVEFGVDHSWLCCKFEIARCFNAIVT